MRYVAVSAIIKYSHELQRLCLKGLKKAKIDRKLAHRTTIFSNRDGRITDNVGPQHAIEIASMTSGEAVKLLAAASNDATVEDAGSKDVKCLLEELQYLPLGMFQVGTCMRLTATPIKEYILLL